MKDKIIKIVGFNMEPERAELIAQQVLDLFAVMQQSEQLPCERCKKLEFMIENGLGWKDMDNDCT